MKIVIVGGGIAGLASVLYLRKLGYEAIVMERAKSYAKIGQGFVLLPNGLAALKSLGMEEDTYAIGTPLPQVTIHSPEGRLIAESYLEEHLGVTRFEFVEMLSKNVKKSWIRMGCKFDHFSYKKDGSVKSIHFANGHEETADLVIAADGGRSRIRKILFPKHHTNDVRVKEFVGIIHAPDIVDSIQSCFRKTKDEFHGLSMGLVPSGNGRLIWYIQYDSDVWDIQTKDPDCLKVFTEMLVAKWPSPAKEILDRTDFKTIHHWHTCDMDPLDSFYKKNVVLIGDACHPMLTFTSQGANCALEDAISLAKSIDNSIKEKKSIQDAFQSFQLDRQDILKSYLESGRNLANKFLHPQKFIGQEELPLAK